MALVLGVDGGGSRTRALLSLDGSEARRYEGGAGNPRAVGFEAAERNLREVAEGACRGFGGPAAVEAACVGLAGAGRAGDKARMEAVLRRIGFPPRTLLTHDARIALAGALRRDVGVVLIAGTGSICYGRGADGSEARCGGWGSLLCDVGSGYGLGLAGLRAAVRAYDGRLPSSLLLEFALSHSGAASAEGLVEWAGSAEKGAVADFARHVFEAAEQGCAEALRIVQEGASGLAEMCAVVIRQLRFGGSAPVSAAGGLALSYPHYARMIEAASARRSHRFSLSAPLGEPVEGAVMLAEGLLRAVG